MKKSADKKSRPKSPTRKTVVLPDDACPSCGATMKETRGALHTPVNGEDVAVPHVPHFRCPKCREQVLTYTQGRRFEEDAIALYRKKYGLLSGDEIRALREHHNLTQVELARLLRLGPNTISRWESARNVQTAALDVLLRLIRDLPGSLDYLRDHAA
ncbi:MAG: type II toxin-antitoxin system MqsA family antitoxin [Deltaproteobacteria bacterium]|nr:type II toxin-antitoxin system MqsA family antitoxin [Deltaproteobacteria bacterium]